MISTMEMATGQWACSGIAPDAPTSGNSATRLDAYAVAPLEQAGLCEHVAARPRYAGMPATLATQDVEAFLSKMAADIAR